MNEVSSCLLPGDVVQQELLPLAMQANTVKLPFQGRTAFTCDDLSGLRDVPDVDAEAEEARRAREQGLGDVERAQVDVEFGDDGARLQFAEVGEEIAQPERGVDELRVERGEDDVRHRDHISSRPCARPSGN